MTVSPDDALAALAKVVYENAVEELGDALSMESFVDLLCDSIPTISREKAQAVAAAFRDRLIVRHADMAVEAAQPKRCEDCIHVRSEPVVDENGPVIGQRMLQCHEGPPSAMVLSTGVAAAFPPVGADWSCSRFVRRCEVTGCRAPARLGEPTCGAPHTENIGDPDTGVH